MRRDGTSGLHPGEGGWVNRAAGVREKGSIDRTVHQLLWAAAPKVGGNLLSIENGLFFHQRHGK